MTHCTRERKARNEAEEAKMMDYEEMEGLKEVAPEAETNKEVREHHYNQANKKWGKWTTSKPEKKILKQQRDQRLFESTHYARVFAPELVVNHEGKSTKKVMMKDTKSSVVKEREQLRDLAREQRQKHETQANRKKKNPVETLRRKKVEQRSTPKEQTLNKAEGHFTWTCKHATKK